MLHTLILLLLQTNLAFLANSFCLDNGNYTTNSTYAANLNAVLSSLPENIDVNGFRNASVGSRNPDIASAIALCRGDLHLPFCRGCIRNLTASLRAECPNQRQAVDWSEFCMLRYSNETIVGTLATSPGIIYESLRNATRPDQYMADARSLLDSLRGPAAGGGPLRKVAARNATAPDAQHIYGMVQCTPDLSSDDCNSCLSRASSIIPTCCSGRIGVRVNLPSCTLRFENSSFYNETRLQELGALAPGPAPESPLAPSPLPSTSPSPSPLLSPPSPSSPSPSPLPSPPSPSPSSSPPPPPPPPSPPPAGIAGGNGGSNTTRNVFTILVSIAAWAILSFWM